MKDLLSLLVAGGGLAKTTAEKYVEQVENDTFDANEDPIAGIMVRAIKEADPDYIGYAVAELLKAKALIEADALTYKDDEPLIVLRIPDLHRRQETLKELGVKTDGYKNTTPQILIDTAEDKNYIITTPKFHGSPFRVPGGRDDNWNTMFDDLSDK